MQNTMDNLGIKSLTTGYYTGVNLENAQTIKFKDYLNKENFEMTLDDRTKIPNLIEKATWEITAMGEIKKLEDEVKILSEEMLSKTKDAIFIKNEVKKSLVSNKNPSTRNIINHYVEKLKTQIMNIFKEKEKNNEFLRQKINLLKSENLAISQKILKLKSTLDDLEFQYGLKKK
jgi:hypothetical protein